MFSALQSASGHVTDFETASKSMHNWRRYPSSNWYEIDQKRGSKFGAVVAPSDVTEKNRNIGAQLQSILYTTA